MVPEIVVGKYVLFQYTIVKIAAMCFDLSFVGNSWQYVLDKYMECVAFHAFKYHVLIVLLV